LVAQEFLVIINDADWLLAFAAIVILATVLIMAVSIFLYYTIRDRGLAKAIVKHTTASKSGRTARRSSR
jgi:hypothetical protein